MDDLWSAEAALWDNATEDEKATIAARTTLRLLPNISFGKLIQNHAANLVPDLRRTLTQVAELTDGSESQKKKWQINRARENLRSTIDIVFQIRRQTPLYSAYAAKSAAATASVYETQNNSVVARASSNLTHSAFDATRAANAAQLLETILRSVLDHTTNDLEIIRTRGEAECWADPLFSRDEEHLLKFWEATHTSPQGQSDSFCFWRDWYQGFLDGKPLDWELQRRITLIDEGTWNNGHQTIANEIGQIRARWQVEKALADLRNTHSARTNARHEIGGNNPPESIQDELLSGAVTLIWEAEKELSTALEQECPARDWIERILEKLKVAFLAITKWLGRKADLAVDTAIVTAIKQGGPLVGGYYALDKLIKALEDWLPYLP